MGAATLSNELGVPIDEGTRLVDSFKNTYSGVTAWMHSAVVDCRSLLFRFCLFCILCFFFLFASGTDVQHSAVVDRKSLLQLEISLLCVLPLYIMFEWRGCTVPSSTTERVLADLVFFNFYAYFSRVAQMHSTMR